jgi:hypothetical protein
LESSQQIKKKIHISIIGIQFLSNTVMAQYSKVTKKIPFFIKIKIYTSKAIKILFQCFNILQII